jgi:hypothetical protein
MMQWLNNYNGSSSFLLSLQNQYRYKGYLSERQLECLAKSVTEASQPRTYSVPVGAKLVLGRTVSERISESLGVDFTHRGFEVVGVHAETAKAILADVKFTATRTVHCCVCGLHLKTEISRSIGIGPVCAEKHGIPYQLDSMGLLQQKLDAVDQVAHKVWIPKSAIKESETQVA